MILHIFLKLFLKIILENKNSNLTDTLLQIRYINYNDYNIRQVSELGNQNLFGQEKYL